MRQGHHEVDHHEVIGAWTSDVAYVYVRDSHMSKSSLSSSARSRASSCSPELNCSELNCSAASIEADRAKDGGCSAPDASAASRPSGSTRPVPDALGAIGPLKGSDGGLGGAPCGGMGAYGVGGSGGAPRL